MRLAQHGILQSIGTDEDDLLGALQRRHDLDLVVNGCSSALLYGSGRGASSHQRTHNRDRLVREWVVRLDHPGADRQAWRQGVLERHDHLGRERREEVLVRRFDRQLSLVVARRIVREAQERGRELFSLADKGRDIRRDRLKSAQPCLSRFCGHVRTHLSSGKYLRTGRLSLGAVRLHDPHSGPQSLLGVILDHQRHDLTQQVVYLLVRVSDPRDDLREGRKELVCGQIVARAVDQPGNLGEVR